MATGVLYRQYDHEAMAEVIKKVATKHVLIAGIKDWLIDYKFGKIIKRIEFPYREYTQQITLYDVSVT